MCFVNRFFYPDESATSQLLTDLCAYLASRGNEVHVVTSRQRHDDPLAKLPLEELCGGVHVHRLRTTRFGRMNLAGRAIDYLTFYVSAFARLRSLIRQGDIVIAKTDPPLACAIAAQVCRSKRARLVNWVQDLFPEVAQRLGVRAARGIAGAAMTRLRDDSLRTAAVNVAVGELMARELQCHAPESRVEVLHNWSHGESVRPIPAPQNPLRAEWNLGDRFVVGYSGNLGRAHEFETILAACEMLRDRSDIAFLFIGSGPQRQRVVSEVQRRRLANVSFRPLQPRTRLSQSLSAADVHVVTLQPALEGLIVPSKFYGIAAAGRPTIFIGDPRGEIPHLIDRAGCGISIETGNHVALAAAIADMASRPERTQEMGDRARQLFDREFDSPLALRRWEELLQSI